MQKGGSQLSPLFLFLHTLVDSPHAYGILLSNFQKTRWTVDSCDLKKVDMTAATKDAPTEIHCSERHTGSSGMTPSSYIPRKMLPVRHGRKGQAQETTGSLLKGNGQRCSCHFRPLLNALCERTKPRRMHENSTCRQHQQKNNPRLQTRRPIRVQGTTTLACQCGRRRRHRCGTHPSHRFSPSQFLFISWTGFAFLRSLSRLLRCIAPHSQSCSVDNLRSARALESANLSRLVSSAAILCSGACIHAGGSSSLQHPSPLSQEPQQSPESSLSSQIEAPSSQVGAR